MTSHCTWIDFHTPFCDIKSPTWSWLHNFPDLDSYHCPSLCVLHSMCNSFLPNPTSKHGWAVLPSRKTVFLPYCKTDSLSFNLQVSVDPRCHLTQNSSWASWSTEFSEGFSFNHPFYFLYSTHYSSTLCNYFTDLLVSFCLPLLGCALQKNRDFILFLVGHCLAWQATRYPCCWADRWKTSYSVYLSPLTRKCSGRISES